MSVPLKSRLEGTGNKELPLEGVLLWDEEIVIAPSDGVITYVSLSTEKKYTGLIQGCGKVFLSFRR